MARSLTSGGSLGLGGNWMPLWWSSSEAVRASASAPFRAAVSTVRSCWAFWICSSKPWRFCSSCPRRSAAMCSAFTSADQATRHFRTCCRSFSWFSRVLEALSLAIMSCFRSNISRLCSWRAVVFERCSLSSRTRFHHTRKENFAKEMSLAATMTLDITTSSFCFFSWALSFSCITRASAWLFAFVSTFACASRTCHSLQQPQA
mmetsp:Transcript_84315/g.202127  ORF Transcript_84315/g.202127 Transcript_84315/m.202127 type:complete len:204 (-) Transcript_84315:1320-1931(-)